MSRGRRFDWERLQDFCAQVLQRAGAPPAEAEVVAESLVYADLRGVDSHGVARFPIYVRRLEQGMVATGVKLDVEFDGPVVRVDGKNAYGAVVGMRALEAAVATAKRHGCAVVGVKHSNHFGTCAYYAERAIAQDLVFLAMSNASQTMPPYGGARPFLGTNPLCVAAPAGNEVPFLLDMATSVVSRGKIIVAAQRGEPIPLGWAVDKDGRPTTDPHAALAGAVLPLGGAKGYGIAMFIDILAGVLTGAGFGKYVHNMYENWQQPQNVGHLFIAIDIARFMPVEVFKARMDRYIRDLKSEPTAPGVDEILVPGELEARTARLRRQQGIELPDAVAKELADVGKRYGVRLDDAEWTSMKREA